MQGLLSPYRAGGKSTALLASGKEGERRGKHWRGREGLRMGKKRQSLKERD
jgi:hypothetical protein